MLHMSVRSVLQLIVDMECKESELTRLQHEVTRLEAVIDSVQTHLSIKKQAAALLHQQSSELDMQQTLDFDLNQTNNDSVIVSSNAY